MSDLLPNVSQTYILNFLLNNTVKLKIFGNNHTPTNTDTVSSLVEISGGGYAAIDLIFMGWVITDGPPAIAVYNAFQDFNFTGIISGAGTVYGYYITTDDDLTLLWEERFAPADVPFTPILGSLIRIKPRMALQTIP